MFCVRGVELILRYPRVRSQHPCRNTVARKDVISRLPRGRCKSSVMLKGRRYHERAHTYPFGFKAVILRLHSLVQICFLRARPLLETRKSQISILDARTAMHYQRYMLCLHFNAPSRFVLRRIKA